MDHTARALIICVFSLFGLMDMVFSQRGHCAGDTCFALFQKPEDFPGAKKSCSGGRFYAYSPTHKAILSSVVGGLGGSYWLEVPSTNETTGAAGPQNCTSISRNLEVLSEPCRKKLDGFLCQYVFENNCTGLQTGGGVQEVTYTVQPMGFEVKDSETFPHGTVAVAKKVGGKYPESKSVCFSGSWIQAPWSCDEELKGGCEHRCNKHSETHTCTCPPGHSLHPNNISCVEVDECKGENLCTGEGEECRNTPGGFECICKDGFDKHDRVCMDVSICNKCEHMKCELYSGAFQCMCRQGFRVSAKDPTKCELHCGERECLAFCITTTNDKGEKKHDCNCPDGYIKDMINNTAYCSDINECEIEGKDRCGDHKCENSHGDYRCLCNQGFELLNDKCVPTEFEDKFDEKDGSGSTSLYPTPASARPASVPSYIKTGSILGITVFMALFAALLFFLVRNTVRRCGKFQLSSLKHHEIDIFYLQQVTTETYKRLTLDYAAHFELNMTGKRRQNLSGHNRGSNMEAVTGLFVIVLTFLTGRAGAIEPNNGYCIGNQCFTVFRDPSDYWHAEKHCRDLSGHLMTVRSSESHDILFILLGNFTGRFWIGLHLPTNCPDVAAELKGYQWVTKDSESDFFNWLPSFDSSCSSNQCVSVSREDDFKWIQEPCGEQRAGFLCEHSFKEPCTSLEVAGGESVTYSTPLGFQGEDLPSLPPGTTAIRMPAETKYVCFSEQWMQAPWSCEIDEGGCEYKCADLSNVPSCYCPQGQAVNPVNKVTCELDTEDPCLTLGCMHVCHKQGDTYACACDHGFKLAKDGRSCVDFNDCTDQRQCPGENFMCVNTLGGFQCVCKDGYKMTGDMCLDVDECVSAPCEHMCANTPGSYECSCYDGYKEDQKAPNKCKLHCGEEECLAECDPNNSFQCNCPVGYILEERRGHSVCIDMDECGSYACAQHCKNTFGGYVCSCSRGYTLVDQHRCVKTDDDTDTDGGSEGSGDTTKLPTRPPATQPSPTRQPSAVTVGGLVGIIVCTVFFIVLVVFLAHHILSRRDKMEHAGGLKAQDGETHGFYLQVSTCDPSCTLYGLVAACSSKHHYWVPALPLNITHLYLEMNYISEINSTSLRAYEQLQQLDLGSQNVQLIIRNNAFLRQRKLTRLVLGDNKGLQLEPRAFAGLYKLQHLFLDHCNLSDSILSENFLQPLLSLEMLDLFGNNIVRVRPGLFFSRLNKFTQLNLKLNRIEELCEEDLVGFRGIHFTFLNLASTYLTRQQRGDFDWERCGNPFRGVAFKTLDLSSIGFSLNTLREFFKAIMGTQIAHLILSGHSGKGFSHDNLPDPDESTFEGLLNSAVEILDLSKSYIFALQEAVFRPLKDAIIIDVSKNKINKINRNAFNGLQGHLRMLNLSSNLLGEIYSHTFLSLTDLRVLDLSYNHIGALGYKAFSGLPRLRALYLTGNSLKNLGYPASLPNLDFLLLSDNKLNSLYSIADFGMSSMHVDVTENRLTRLDDVYDILTRFSRLQNLFFGGNLIKWCTLSPNVTLRYSSLQVLDLHDSSLQVIWAQGTCLDLFDPFESLLGLNLSFNSLASLPNGIFSGLSSIVEIDLSSNALTYLQSDVFPVSLKRLYLANNFLASPDPTTFQSLSFLSLSANRFYCDCNLESFLKWLNVTNVTFLSPIEEYRCEFPADLHKLPLLDYSTEPCEEDDEKRVQDLRFALFVISALLIATVTISGLVYARLRGALFIIYKKITVRVLQGPKPIRPVGDVKYDAFLCFSDSDYGWVEAALLKKLDNQFSENNIFNCCFEARDFLPGEDHLSIIRDAIWGSRKTVCVVSNEFLKDGWCLEAFTLAQVRMLEELTNVLIMLVVGKVAHYQLMKYNAVRAYVQRREYLVWPEDPQDMEWFYERLISQILKDTEVKKFAEDNPQAAQPNIQPQNEEAVELEEI
uniref:uncharacterized protein n=1 Tax=Semicossyphus pulcher TaxID=241346 RepID=UPI0037E9B39D